MKQSMVKRVGSALLALCLCVSLAACGGSGTSSASSESSQSQSSSSESQPSSSESQASSESSDASAEETGTELSGKVTVYMPSPAGLADKIAAAFTEKTGVEVEQFQGTTGEILARLETEAANPVADVVILASWSDGLSMKEDGQIVSYTPENADKINEGWVDEDSMLFGYSASAVGVIYNTTVYPELSADWAGLADSQYADDIAIPDPEKIRPVASQMLAGGTAAFWSQWPVAGECPSGVVPAGQEAAQVQLTIRDTPEPALKLVPRIVWAGIGCRRGVPAERLEAALRSGLEAAGLHPAALAGVCTIDRKGEEPGLLELCRRRRLPLLTYSPEELSRAEGEFTPSPFVRQVTGTDNVCERAAVLASGGPLLLKKTAGEGVTAALAAAPFAPGWEEAP